MRKKTSADREPYVFNMSYSFHVFFFFLPARATYWRLPGSRLYVLVSTRRAMHPIQRCLLASAHGWRTIFCLRSEGEHTYTHFLQGKKKKKQQPDKHTLLLGVLLQYISSSLSFCMICLPNTCLECGGGCAARSPFQSPRMLGGKWRYYLSALAVSWGCFREIQGGNW